MTAQARLLGGRYQVGELLGYGGMAEVHRGRDLRLGRDVAIKMLRTDLARDDTFQLRFRREAQNAASLNHPAIVAVYDTGEEIAPTGETIPFIVMEFVNGRTLKEVLATEGRLMPRRALEITADVCAALEFSHRHGIIHRDIKPGNVMLTLTGQVKVMDFGIARALASGATTMTQTSAVIGTAQYLSPEQARGEAVDARSDVYAAGCVLFELLCSHPPFVGDSPVSVAYQHVREDPRAPSEINPDVTPPIDAIVLKALSKNPLNRYQSAGEMRADLLRAAAGRPVAATPVLRRDETVAMAPGAAAVGPPTAATRPIPAGVGDPRRRASTWVLATMSAVAVLAVLALVAGLIFLTQQGDDLVAVPDVRGRSEADAKSTLTRAGLRPVLGDLAYGDCAKGLVASQSPMPTGERVKQDSPVTLRICGGQETVEVPPRLVGRPFEEVKAALEAEGLEVKPNPKDSEKPENEVLKLSHAEGSTVAKGTEITVEYSKGNMLAVPEVRGMTADEAEEVLKDAGFRVRQAKGDEVDNPEEVGRVTRQSPSAGTLKTKGSTITITVSQPRSEPSATPSVTPTTPGGGAGGGPDDLLGDPLF